MKNYTDIKQSKTLAEILPLESADMLWGYWYNGENHCIPNIRPFRDQRNNIPNDYIPAWSLTALLNVLPDEITDDYGDVYRNMFFHLKGKYIIQYPRLTTLWPSLLSEEADNPVDACVNMIIKLYEQKRL